MNAAEDSGRTAIGVLLVDDEANILAALRRLLIDEEFIVHTATSGAEGLEILRQEAGIGVIVSDQRMPGMSGAEFLEQARQVAPEALRMVLTGYADIHDAMAAINRGGASRYIAKPWDDRELVLILREAVRHYGLLQENRRLSALVQQQNEELKEWNARLKSKVLQQTADIRRKNEELHEKNSRLKKTFQNTLEALSGLIELQAKELRRHTRNVAEVSVMIARNMDYSADAVEELQVAALLHDIGEIGNPGHLSRQDINELSQSDLELYMQHTIRGQAAIDVIEDLRGAGILIRHHHERFGGTGFPDRLQGAEIPPGARIMAMADFVDRRIAHRRRENIGNAIELVLQETQARLGTWFDPHIFPFLAEPVRQVYGRGEVQTGFEERLLTPELLQEGMRLAEDLFSGTGLLLLHKGALLDQGGIAAIRRFNQLDPFPKGIAVLLVKEERP